MGIEALLLAAAIVQPPHALAAAPHAPLHASPRAKRRPVTVAMLPTPFAALLVPAAGGVGLAAEEHAIDASIASSHAGDRGSPALHPLPRAAPAVADAGLVRSAIEGLHALFGDANTAVALKARMMLSRAHASHVELGTIYAPLPGDSYYDQARQSLADRRWLSAAGRW